MNLPGSGHAKWVEFYNPTDTDIALAHDHTLRTNGVEYPLTDHTVPAGGYFVYSSSLAVDGLDQLPNIVGSAAFAPGNVVEILEGETVVMSAEIETSETGISRYYSYDDPFEGVPVWKNSTSTWEGSGELLGSPGAANESQSVEHCQTVSIPEGRVVVDLLCQEPGDIPAEGIEPCHEDNDACWCEVMKPDIQAVNGYDLRQWAKEEETTCGPCGRVGAVQSSQCQDQYPLNDSKHCRIPFSLKELATLEDTSFFRLRVGGISDFDEWEDFYVEGRTGESGWDRIYFEGFSYTNSDPTRMLKQNELEDKYIFESEELIVLHNGGPLTKQERDRLLSRYSDDEELRFLDPTPCNAETNVVAEPKEGEKLADNKEAAGCIRFREIEAAKGFFEAEDESYTFQFVPSGEGATGRSVIALLQNMSDANSDGKAWPVSILSKPGETYAVSGDTIFEDYVSQLSDVRIATASACDYDAQKCRLNAKHDQLNDRQLAGQLQLHSRDKQTYKIKIWRVSYKPEMDPGMPEVPGIPALTQEFPQVVIDGVNKIYGDQANYEFTFDAATSNVCEMDPSDILWMPGKGWAAATGAREKMAKLCNDPDAINVFWYPCCGTDTSMQATKWVTISPENESAAAFCDLNDTVHMPTNFTRAKILGHEIGHLIFDQYMSHYVETGAGKHYKRDGFLMFPNVDGIGMRLHADEMKKIKIIPDH